MTNSKKIIENPDLLLNARKPEGELGDKLIEEMNEHHEGLAQWSVSHLNISKEDIILDIGCGGGVNVKRFLNITENKVFGIDYSKIAVEKSSLLNQSEIDKGRCEIINASVSQLPFKDHEFNIVTAFENCLFLAGFC